MPPMTSFMIATRAARGSFSDASSSFESQPGRTVMRRPSARSVPRATTAGLSDIVIRMFARAPNPLATGPGADASTSTPCAPSST